MSFETHLHFLFFFFRTAATEAMMRDHLQYTASEYPPGKNVENLKDYNKSVYFYEYSIK